MAGGIIVSGDKKEYPGKMTAYVFLACIFAATGGAIFGYDIGISGGVVLSFHRRLEFIQGKKVDEEKKNC